MKIGKTFLTAAVLASLCWPAHAELIRVANSQKGTWDNTLVVFGEQKGFFKEQNIELEMTWTDGGSDALQGVVAGSMDLVIGTGALGLLSAWSKGAPVVPIASGVTGSPDVTWFVRKDSPIKTLKDLEGKTIAYSRPGASTQLIAQQVASGAGVNAKLVPTGGMASTLTAVMSGQVDVGWLAAPGNAELIEKGEIRTLFTGNDAPGMENQTVRIFAANANWLAKNQDLARRFLAAQKKTTDWAYSSDEAAQMWADYHKITLAQAKQFLKSNYPRSMFQMTEIKSLDLTIKQAIETKRLDKPLTEAQAKEFVKHLAILNK